MGGEDVQNEITAYKSFTLFGSSLCPVTGKRSINGTVNSAQAWCENHSPASVVTKSIDAEEMIDTLKDQSPNWEKVRGQFEEMTINDIVINNQDRHINNFLINDELDDIRAIDHGYAFNKGLSGFTASIFDGFHSKKMHLRLNVPLWERFENTTFGDMKRAYGDDTLEWKTAQSYMRMRYIMQVASDNDGRLPLTEFKNDPDAARVVHKLSPNQKFEKSVHDFIDNNIDDPSSPDHATAVHFAQEGILMPSAAGYDDAEVRRRGDQFRHEMESRRKIAEMEQGLAGEKSFMADANTEFKEKEAKLREAVLKKAEPLQVAAQPINREQHAAQKEVWAVQREIKAASANGEIHRIPGLMDYEQEAITRLAEASAARKKHEAKQKEIWDQWGREVYDLQDQIYADLTPPGQEKAFERLRDQLQRARTPIRERKPLEKPAPRPPQQSAAAGIERKKREAWEKQRDEAQDKLWQTLKEKGVG
jgi:hypothetical protein